VKEGEINLKVLVEFFSQHADLPKVVCVSEDATAINKRREYDRKTNSIIGSSGFLNEDGLPEPTDFIVKKAEDITSHFDRFEPATVAFVVVANPICGDFPGIRIAAFGSNNKFTSIDVQKRANAIERELKKEGIEMLIYSADGDSRELKTMRQKINLGARLPKEKGGFKKKCFLYFFNILIYYFLLDKCIGKTMSARKKRLNGKGTRQSGRILKSIAINFQMILRTLLTDSILY